MPTGYKRIHDNVTIPMESQPSQDTALMQQLLLEQQKQQTLLLNQQELLMGLQEGHKELMEKVQHKEANNNHNSSEREWWIKKLLQQPSSLPTMPHKNNSLKSQSFPNLGVSSQPHLIGHKGATVFKNTTVSIHSQKLTKEKGILNNSLSFKEASSEETVLESQGLLTQASVAVEACKDSSPTHNLTYQSCGTNTHNLVDAAVNTAPLTVDICIGTEWAISSSSSSDNELEKKPSRTIELSETSPQGTKEQSTTTTTPEKEPPTEDSVDLPSQPATSSSPDHLNYVINQEVLARSMDGCYYWGVVLQYNQQPDSYIVEDLDSRQQLMMTRSDFITETQDGARTVLQLYDRALAPRVLSPNCFLPGRHG